MGERTVVVTGAASGYETVRKFAALGDRVLAVGRVAPPATSDPPPVTWLTADVSRPEDAERMVAAAGRPVAILDVDEATAGVAGRSTLFLTTMRHPGEDGRVEGCAGALFAWTVDATGRPPTRHAG